MKELVGHTVKELYVNEDQSLLKFVTDKATIVYYTEGDCCSECWFADILLGWEFFKSPVVSVEETEAPEWVCRVASKDGRGRQEYEDVYGFQIKTGPYQNSTTDVIFRNSSNGYYGGWCALLENYTEDSFYGKKLNSAEWTQITDDWQA